MLVRVFCSYQFVFPTVRVSSCINMQTTYYCPKCDVRFAEEGTPNINKRHAGCGDFMQIEEHKSIEETQGTAAN